MPAIMFKIYVNGQQTNFHLTLCNLIGCSKQNFAVICQEIIHTFGRFFGRNNVFELNFTEPLSVTLDKIQPLSVPRRPGNSFSVTSWNPNVISQTHGRGNLGIREIFANIIDHLEKSVLPKYPGVSIDTSRYGSKIVPPHIDMKGQNSCIGQTWQVTYAL